MKRQLEGSAEKPKLPEGIDPRWTLADNIWLEQILDENGRLRQTIQKIMGQEDVSPWMK